MHDRLRLYADLKLANEIDPDTAVPPPGPFRPTNQVFDSKRPLSEISDFKS